MFLNMLGKNHEGVVDFVMKNDYVSATISTCSLKSLATHAHQHAIDSDYYHKHEL